MKLLHIILSPFFRIFLFCFISLFILTNVVFSGANKQLGSSPKIEVNKLWDHALILEKEGKIEEALMIYEKIINDFPEAVLKGEVESGLYSNYANVRKEILLCQKSKGADFSSFSKEEIVNLVISAIRKREGDKLSEIASCEFFVGKTESDAVWAIYSTKGILFIMESGHKINWSSLSEKSTEQISFITFKYTNNQNISSFRFNKVADRWKWTGFYANEKKILDQLWETRIRK